MVFEIVLIFPALKLQLFMHLNKLNKIYETIKKKETFCACK